MRGLNEARRSRIVTQSLADLANGDFEHRFADKRPGPYCIKKFLFCDELTRMPEKIVEDGEGLWPHLDGLGAFPEALVGKVEAKGIEGDVFCVPHRRYRYRKLSESLC